MVWEIWQALHIEKTQVEFADLVGLSERQVRRMCATATAPERDREARHVLLNMALEIPEPERSEDLDAWIEEQRAEFERRPLGGVFR